jgi:hypothetical protein
MGVGVGARGVVSVGVVVSVIVVFDANVDGAATLDVDLDVGGQITPPRNISARSPMYMSC